MADRGYTRPLSSEKQEATSTQPPPLGVHSVHLVTILVCTVCTHGKYDAQVCTYNILKTDSFTSVHHIT